MFDVWPACPCKCLKKFCVCVCCTYREQYDGDSQSDGGENSQTDEQQQGVKFIDLGEGVKQFCFYVACVEGKARKKTI